MAFDDVRSCNGKTRHPRRGGADAAAFYAIRRYGLALEAYRCAWCDGWHVGRSRR